MHFEDLLRNNRVFIIPDNLSRNHLDRDLISLQLTQCKEKGSTISDNNIGQWLPFPPYPLPDVVLQVQKNIERIVDIIIATLKEGKRGEGFRLRVARDFWLRLYSLYMLGISMVPFQACHVIDFQKDIIKTAKRKQT